MIFLPYLMGTGSPHLDYSARGSFVGLTPDHGKGELVRAIMEGVTMALRESLELAEEAGAEITDLRLGAGATRSDLWNQIQADIYGRPVHLVNTTDPSPLGAALLAGVGTEVYSDIEEAAETAVNVTTRIEPEPSRRKIYDQLFQLFKEIYGQLRPSFPRLEDLAAKAETEEDQDQL